MEPYIYLLHEKDSKTLLLFRDIYEPSILTLSPERTDTQILDFLNAGITVDSKTLLLFRHLKNPIFVYLSFHGTESIYLVHKYHDLNLLLYYTIGLLVQS